jgi:hypothetical protein
MPARSQSPRVVGFNPALQNPAANPTRQQCKSHNDEPARRPPPRRWNNRVVFDSVTHSITGDRIFEQWYRTGE